jgi:hypothetical protein
VEANAVYWNYPSPTVTVFVREKVPAAIHIGTFSTPYQIVLLSRKVTALGHLNWVME